MLTHIRTIGLVLAGLCLTVTGCGEVLAPFQARNRTTRTDRMKMMKHARRVTPMRTEFDRSDRLVASRPLSNGPQHYYSHNPLVMVRRPGATSQGPVSRVEVWWTDNNGFRWRKAGTFKSGQNFFPFEVEEDGDYGIRFVGLDRAGAKRIAAETDRIYHVDRTRPDVQVALEPERFEYHVGDRLTIHWEADDLHLEEQGVRIGLLTDTSVDESRLVELQRDLAGRGSIRYEIPPEMIRREITLRVEATDRAGNIGLAYSCSLPVVDTPKQAEPTETVQPSDLIAMITDTGETAPPTESDSTHAPPVYAESEAPADHAIIASKSEAEGQGVAMAPTESIEAESGKMTDEAISERIVTASLESEALAPSEPVVMTSAVTGEAETTQAERSETPVDDPELMILVSPVVPFATAVARLPKTDSRLVWEGSRSAAFPDSRLTDSRRTDDGLFSERAKDRESGGFEPIDAAVARVDRPDDGGQPMESPDAVEGLKSASAVESNNPDPMAGISSSSSIEGDAARDGVARGAETPAASWTDGGLSAIDLTRGNALLIPLPATVEPIERRTAWATAHPWRVLGNVWSSPIRTVWALGEPRLLFGWKPAYKGRFLADNPILRTVSAPARRPTSRIAGLPEETIETLSDTGP